MSGPAGWTQTRLWGSFDAMTTDWRHRLIISKLIEGYTTNQASAAAGVTKMAVWQWRQAMPDFAQAVTAARELGRDERTFRLWLRHPFRGKRPPTGKDTRSTPRFRYGRR